MNVALWILQVLVALLFLMAGGAKAFRPLDKLTQQWDWIGKVPPRFVRFLGVSELAGAVGLILPATTAILPQLTIAAALGLAVVMGSATAFHVSRREYPSSVRALVILLLTLTIAVGRWKLAHV